MSEAGNEILLGKLRANQDAMRSELDDIKALLTKHEETFTYFRGQRSALVWVGSAVIAAAAAVGLSVNKVLMWLISH